MKSKQIAFLGLGNMGRPMALNLARAGHSLIVYDIMEAAVQQTLEEAKKETTLSIKSAKSPHEAVCEAEVVITMLPSSPHVKELYLGSGKLIDSVKDATLLIDCSTIAPDTAKEVASEAKKRRALLMADAPVSGGTAGAAAGTLTFIVGADAQTFDLAKPILEKMGKNIFHAGTNGMGQVAKICNNMLLAIHMIGTAEALSLGKSFGMDPKILSEIMSKSSGRNWSLELYNPHPGIMENVPSSRAYQGGFAVDLMAKDLGLSQEASASSRSSTPLGALATQLYRLHSAQGSGKLDFSSIIELFGKKLG